MRKTLALLVLLLAPTLASAAYVPPDPGGRDGIVIDTSTGDVILRRAGSNVLKISSSGDVTLLGGAGTLTCGASGCSLLATDNSATGFKMGSTGALATMTLDTRDAAEGWIVTGYLSVSGATTVTGALYANGGVDRSSAAGLTIGATNATSVTITPATTIIGAATLSSTLGVASGVSTLSGGVVSGATRNTGTGATLTTASSGYLHVAAASTDAATTFILPAASTKARYCFAVDDVTGSNRELKIETPAGSDLIVGTTTATGGTGIATTAGANHGIKNTHATAVRGNNVCVAADGTNTWYMVTPPCGTFAAY